MIITSCNTTPNLPILVEDNMDLVPTQEAIIYLESLNSHTSSKKWEQFFVQRNAKKIWEILQLKNDDLYFVLSDNEQQEEIVAGIIYYLNFYKSHIKLIEFKGLKTNVRFPAEICNLTDLSRFNLISNKITVLPLEIFDLPNLTELNLSDNCQQEILSNNISKLTTLRCLDLSSNKLLSIPDSIIKLSNINYLNLSWNHISTLLYEISNLKELRNLYLPHNKIEILHFRKDDFKQLATLDLTYNQIKQIPEEIGNLNNLQTLKLSHNQIKHVSAAIGNCTKLKILDLSHNKIQVLPNEIGEFSNLQELILSNNRLATLPTGEIINNFTSLRKLDLTCNPLTKLPASILPKFNDSQQQLLVDIRIHSTFNTRTRLTAVGLSNHYSKYWIQPKDKRLMPVNEQQIRKIAYRKFHSFSLLTLCTQYIKTHYQLFDENVIEDILPNELQELSREYLFRKAYQWKAGRNIIFFKMIENTFIPFYLDYKLINLQAIENMLVKLKEEPLYKLKRVKKKSKKRTIGKRMRIEPL
ncbi:MAG: leucine-rich repeat domain-containing protein [Candidatus Amoebophilus sp.]